MSYGLLSLLTLALWVFCLADAITRDDAEVRHLPKLLWILIIVCVPLAGSILWLAIGRPPVHWSAGGRSQTRYSEYDRPGRFVPQNPESDEDFLRRCRERAEEQRRVGKEILRAQRAAEEQKKQEQEES